MVFLAVPVPYEFLGARCPSRFGPLATGVAYPIIKGIVEYLTDGSVNCCSGALIGIMPGTMPKRIEAYSAFLYSGWTLINKSGL